MILDNMFKLILLTSAMGTVVALIIFLIKGIFKNKLSPTWHYYIWILLLIRLLMPYSLSSSYSVFNLLNMPFHNTVKLDSNEKNTITNSFKWTIDKSFFNLNNKVNVTKSKNTTIAHQASAPSSLIEKIP